MSHVEPSAMGRTALYPKTGSSAEASLHFLPDSSPSGPRTLENRSVCKSVKHFNTPSLLTLWWFQKIYSPSTFITAKGSPSPEILLFEVDIVARLESNILGRSTLFGDEVEALCKYFAAFHSAPHFMFSQQFAHIGKEMSHKSPT